MYFSISFSTLISRTKYTKMNLKGKNKLLLVINAIKFWAKAPVSRLLLDVWMQPNVKQKSQFSRNESQQGFLTFPLWMKTKREVCVYVRVGACVHVCVSV